MVEVIDKTVPLGTDSFWEAERLDEPVEVEREFPNQDQPDKPFVRILKAHYKVVHGEGEEAETLLLTPNEMWKRFKAVDGTGRRELARGNGGASA